MNTYNEQVETKACAECGQPFTAHPTNKYCKPACKRRAKEARKRIGTTASAPTSKAYRTQSATAEKLTFICNELLAITNDEDTRSYEVNPPLPPDWIPPKGIMCVLKKHKEWAKNFYEITKDPDGESTMLEVDAELNKAHVDEVFRRSDEILFKNMGFGRGISPELKALADKINEQQRIPNIISSYFWGEEYWPIKDGERKYIEDYKYYWKHRVVKLSPKIQQPIGHLYDPDSK